MRLDDFWPGSRRLQAVGSGPERRGPAVVAGVVAALAVSLPAALLAQILDAALDGGLPATVTVPLSIVVLAGAVVGGAIAGWRLPGHHRLAGALVGLAALLVVGGLGLARRAAADTDADALVVPVLAVWGAGLGWLGSTLGAWWAGRTRR